MKKAVFVLVVLVLGVGGLRAQHFEWAKGYSGSDRGTSPDNYIVGAVTDREGNLYILGQCSPNAIYGNQNLNEGAYYHSGTNNTLIAKISPQGEMVWHKIISNDRGTQAFDIRMQGDTEIVCMVDFTITHHLYYLDTMLRTVDNTLMPIDSIAVYWFTAFIWLDLDGNVKEQHFLQEAYIDTAGRVITTNIQTGGQIPTDHAFTSAFPSKSFDIDNEGNIYMVKATNDLAFISCDTCPDGFLHPSIENGLLSGYAVYLDGRRVYDIYPEGRPKVWNPILIKCSPHFNRLIRWQNIFQDEMGDATTSYTDASLYLELDNLSDKLYLNGNYWYTWDNAVSATLTGNHNLTFFKNIASTGVLIKFDTLFHPHYIKQIDMGGSRDTCNRSAKAMFYFCLCEDENLFIIGTISGRGGDENYEVTMDGNSLSIMDSGRNSANAFFLRLNSTTGNIQSYHKVKTEDGGCGVMSRGGGLRPFAVAKNGRLMFNLVYNGRLHGNDTIMVSPDQSQVGLVQYSYDGELIKFSRYGEPTTNNDYTGGVLLVDSIVYITGTSYTTMLFGEQLLNGTGASMAYIAKYVDTSFMTPYVYTGDTGNVRIVVAEGGTWTSYPNPFRQRVTIESDGQAVRTAWLTDLTGRREEVRLQAAGPGRYVLDLTGRPQATYLLTLVTADGQERTLRLLKQQDMFGE